MLLNNLTVWENPLYYNVENSGWNNGTYYNTLIYNNTSPYFTVETIDTHEEQKIKTKTEMETFEAEYPSYCESLEEGTSIELDNIINSHEHMRENSPTLLISEENSRFNGAIWYDTCRQFNIIVGGAGGICSWLILLLARLNEYISVYDMDTVEMVNMAGQLYSKEDVGKSKVVAISNTAYKYSNQYIHAIVGAYTENSSVAPVMICGFDNMEARKCFYNKWKRHVEICNPEKCLFIDGRLAAEEFQIFCIRGNDDLSMERYERDWLFSDSEADSTTCSYKQTSFTANMIASLMTNLYVNFCAIIAGDIMGRDLPFYTYYDAVTMFLKTEA